MRTTPLKERIIGMQATTVALCHSQLRRPIKLAHMQIWYGTEQNQRDAGLPPHALAARSAYLIEMRKSNLLRENAENCLQLAEKNGDGPSVRRYRRMADAWLALAHEQDWLDGEVNPDSVAPEPSRPGR
jgi:hypothetical protein